MSSTYEKLSKLLEKELEILKQIQMLSGKQTQSLAEDDVDALNSSLDKTQELMEKINGLHQESDPLMQSYISSSGSEANNKIKKLKQQIEDIVESCAEVNSKNTETIKA